MLNWNTRINQVVKKANNIRAFLQMNIYQCHRKTKDLCYKALVTCLVRTQMEYFSIIWNPYIQRTAVEMVFNEGRPDLLLVITIEPVV